jgi:hypothetical protein
MLKQLTFYSLSALLISAALAGLPATVGLECCKTSTLETATDVFVPADSPAKFAAVRPHTARDNRKLGDEDAK